MLYNICQVKKIYGNRTVLDIDSLDIDRGKIYTLIGPNGAGKTTLLNILSFLSIPSAGKVKFNGKQVHFNHYSLHRQRQKVVLVDQHPLLFTGPVWKNIEYGLKVRKIEKKKRQMVVKAILEMVGMSDFAHADAHKLSGGETKRVALARALAVEPEVLLCDEPTANVDAENQEIILKILEHCNASHKISLIFATHYLSQAQRLADHTIILHNGRLSSTQRDNIFSAQPVKHQAGRVTWLVGGCQELVTKDIMLPQADTRTLYIDPQRIVIVKASDSASKENRWRGVVTKVVKVDKSIQVTVDCGVDLNVVVGLEENIVRFLIINEKVDCVLPVDIAMLFGEAVKSY